MSFASELYDGIGYWGCSLVSPPPSEEDVDRMARQIAESRDNAEAARVALFLREQHGERLARVFLQSLVDWENYD